MENIIALTEEYLIHTYVKSPVVLERGDGMYLYDTEGRQYLDFAAGIAVCALGHGNKKFQDRLKEQIDKLLHTSNLFYNEWSGRAAACLCRASGMDRAFFTNSGTEAIEGALKLARKAFYLKTGHAGGEIIAMDQSFHGRSMGAVSVTGQEKYREAFEPLIGGVKFAEFNNLDSVKNLVTENTCAIIFETVQGEGGIYPATEEFIKGVRQLCDETGILLILDEIQSGMARTGTMFAYEHYGIKPDILASAKGLGCGIPVGAFAAVEKAASAMTPGDHGTTYGGNPFASAAVCEVFSAIEELNLVEHTKEAGTYLQKKLDEIASSYDCVLERRGLGLMQGLELTIPVKEVCGRALENGLILISAGPSILRFVPPLIVSKPDIDQMIQILTTILDGIQGK